VPTLPLDAGPEQFPPAPRRHGKLGDLILEGLTKRRRQRDPRLATQSARDPLGDITGYLDPRCRGPNFFTSMTLDAGLSLSDNSARVALSIRDCVKPRVISTVYAYSRPTKVRRSADTWDSSRPYLPDVDPDTFLKKSRLMERMRILAVEWARERLRCTADGPTRCTS